MEAQFKVVDAANQTEAVIVFLDWFDMGSIMFSIQLVYRKVIKTEPQALIS